MKKVLIIYGGNSSEHEISCISAQSILKNIDNDIYDVQSVYLNQNNEWLLNKNNDQIKIENLILFLNQFDVVFPVIHGKIGEDGKIQTFFELFDIKYVGCDSRTSFISFDKDLTKQIIEKNNIPNVPYKTIFKNNNKKELKNLKFPLIVKPAKEGSSIGISVVKNKKELKKAIKIGFQYDNKLLIEPFLNVIELEVAILEDKKFIISNIGEINTNKKWYSFDEKYKNNNTTCSLKSSLNNKQKKEVLSYVKKIINILNIKGLSRIDFFYDIDNDKIYFNEINTMPGFTEISMYANLIMSQGYTYKELISVLIDNAK